MKFANLTPFPTATTQDASDREVRLCVTTKVSYEVRGGAMSLLRRGHPVHETPCDEAPLSDVRPRRSEGLVEVTFVGSIRRAEPFARVTVRLSVGPAARSLVVSGPRRWARVGRELVPTEPVPTRTVEMSWRHAYGGVHLVPAGWLPGTTLPCPTMRTSAVNPHGRGFYLLEANAEGGPLPQLEDADTPIRRWEDRPLPACWAAMPLDLQLRASHLAPSPSGRQVINADGRALPVLERVRANAPPTLQFDAIPPGTPISLEGHTSGDPMQFNVPAAPFQLRARASARQAEPVPPALVGIQLRADEATVCLLYAASVRLPLIRGEERTAVLERAS